MHGCASCVERVIDAVLALFHFDLGHAADADHGNATGQLGHALLQLFAVVVRGGVLDLLTDLADPCFDLGLFASAIDDGGRILGDRHLLGAAQHVHANILKLHAEVFADHLTTGQNGDVLQHGLATVAKAGGLDGSDLEAAAQFVHDEGCEGFAFDILGNDQERLLRLDHLLEQRHHRLKARQLLLVQQDEAVF